MTYTICGYCSQCGAAMHVPTVWYGVYPPNPQPSCGCVRQQTRTLGPTQPFGPVRPTRSIERSTWDQGWDPYVNPRWGFKTRDEWEQYRNKLATHDADGDSHYGDSYPARGLNTQAPINREEELRLQRKIKETRKVVEQVRENAKRNLDVTSKQAEEQDLTGIESLGQALEESSQSEKLVDLEKRMDRMETMVINMTKALGEVRALLQEAKAREERLADDGK